MSRFACCPVIVLTIVFGVASVGRAADRHKVPPLVLKTDMEWTGSFAREYLKRNAANLAVNINKVRSSVVTRFRMHLTDVQGTAVVGEFSYRGADREEKVLKFKGSFVPKTGQFQFKITEVLKGNQDTSVLQCGLVGGFGPNGESVAGNYVAPDNRRTVFEGDLSTPQNKNDKKN